MTHKRPRYGLEGNVIENLYGRWKGRIYGDSEWKTFDEFVKWASETGYQKGVHLIKKNNDFPWGPGNAVWMSRVRMEEEKQIETEPEEPEEEDDPVPDLCAVCVKEECTLFEHGCPDWKRNFVQYWDKYIHRKIENGRIQKEKFSYEHPDLVREGIAFESDKHL